jgi:hypothetical protein
MRRCARFAITSFAFMFVLVPAPPWMTSTVKCSWSASSFRSSSHEDAIASWTFRGRRPISKLARAHAFLTNANARMKSGYALSLTPVMS